MASFKCENYGCESIFDAWPSKYAGREYIFCSSCRKDAKYKALVAQVNYQEPIKKILITLLRQHKNPSIMADLLGISRLTLYNWIRDFFEVESFKEFKRKYLCKGKACIPLSKNDLDPVARQLVTTRFRNHNICTCSIKGQKVILVLASMKEIKNTLQDVSEDQ
jgi:hypothetical protein